MTIADAHLESFFRHRLSAGDVIIFPFLFSFVFSSFLLSVLLTAVNALIVSPLLFMIAFLYLLQLSSALSHDDATLLRDPALIPFAFFSDLFISFALLLYLSRPVRVAGGALSAKAAYFRLRVVGFNRLVSCSSCDRMLYQLWYQQRELTALWVIDTSTSILVYAPACINAYALSQTAEEGSSPYLFLRVSAIIFAVACVLAQATAVHAALQWLVDGCRREVGEKRRPEVAPCQLNEEVDYAELSEGDEVIGRPLPMERLEFSKVAVGEEKHWREPGQALEEGEVEGEVGEVGERGEVRDGGLGMDDLRGVSVSRPHHPHAHYSFSPVSVSRVQSNSGGEDEKVERSVSHPHPGGW